LIEEHLKLILFALSGSFLAGMATSLGAIPVFFGKFISPKTEDILLGFSGGIMLAASFFSLLSPAIDMLIENYHSKLISSILASFGFGMGAVIFWIADKFLPSDYILKKFAAQHKSKISLKGIWLFTLAITVHNFPEGMSSAMGFLTGDIGRGIALASGIGIQNIPEGLAVALALVSAGYSKKFAFFISMITGLVEPIGGLVGILIFGFTDVILPIGLSFAAGAMIFVISKEVIPETHKKGFELEATTGLMIGFILMMILDISLS